MKGTMICLGMAIALVLLIVAPGYSSDRCINYAQDVRIQYEKYFGLSFPFWYGLGQLRQESRCRGNVTAFDGGKGLAQFMPATEKYIKKLMGAPDLDPYNPEHAIRMQAFYMKRLDKSNFAPDKGLWITYMFYNSGTGTVRKEYRRSGVACWAAMRGVCKRRVIHLKSGRNLDLCNVGYDYPVKIYKYGQRYRTGIDRRRYW